MTAIRLPIPSLAGQETERLRFRAITLQDVDLWMDYMNDAQAIRFMPFTLGSRADCTFMLQRSLDRYSTDGSGLYMLELKETGVAVGQCGLLTQTVDGEPELEVGYHFLPQHWGHGYATEAARFCMRFAEQSAIAPSIISLIDHENHRSQNVARRNGLVAEKNTVHRGHPAVVFRAVLAM